MPHRLYDYECSKCHHTAEHLTWSDAETAVPLRRTLTCKACDSRVSHRRVMSLPAKYTGERVDKVLVYGSDLDTAGFRQPDQPFPRPPGMETGEVSADTWKSHFETPAWKAWSKEKKARDGENRKKRRRAAAIKRGENVNLRRDRAPGDPKR